MEAGGDTPEREAQATELSRALGLHPLAARVLAARGLCGAQEAARFLSAPLEDLPDPFTMKGMDRAVARIMRALAVGERIACYGDYDVDGVTSVVLLTGFLRAAGAEVVTYVPHRLSEGYGLNGAAVSKLAGRGCGCSSPSTAESPASRR